MTSIALRKEILKLSISKRLELVEVLWDSIAEKDRGLALSAEQREDLELRLAEANASPDERIPWEGARERIRQRLK